MQAPHAACCHAGLPCHAECRAAGAAAVLQIARAAMQDSLPVRISAAWCLANLAGTLKSAAEQQLPGLQTDMQALVQPLVQGQFS